MMSDRHALTLEILSYSNNRLIQSQTTSGPRARERVISPLSAFRLHSPSSSGPSYAGLIAEDFALLGLIPFELTRAEATRAKETPGISPVVFYRKFGGCRTMDWPRCHKIPGYADFLCADPFSSQPYVPTDVGKPGLVFYPPATPRRERLTFHVISCSPHDKLLHYQGEYTTIPLPDIQITWSNIPGAVRVILLLTGVNFNLIPGPGSLDETIRSKYYT